MIIAEVVLDLLQFHVLFASVPQYTRSSMPYPTDTAMDATYSPEKSNSSLPVEKVVDSESQYVSKDVVANVSGHSQELERQFGLLSICATGIVTGNTWTALGGAIVSLPLLRRDEATTHRHLDRCVL